MIETLLPAAACFEMFTDVPEWQMFSSEAAIVANAAAKRRREFCTVRYCGREALRKIGASAAPILPDTDGTPRWPVGVVGSLTHCSGYRAAVVARSSALRGVGIDAEVDVALPPAVPDLVLRDEERAQLRTMAETYPHRHWDTILFCAKEAVFKAWFPITRSWLDFLDVSVTVRPAGTFLAFVHRSLLAGIGPVFAGRWVVGNGVIVAATSVSQRQRETTRRATPRRHSPMA
jgi:4'-phosphopantetheinyl transferase EntD